MRAFACVSSLALLSSAAFSQSTETPPAFEFSDVHAVAPGANQFMRGGLMRGGRYELRTATMVDLIKTAYGVDDDNVIGGPNWLEFDRFDLIAKAAPSSSPERIQLMLQALLADRFHLVVHNDTKSLPEYVLTLGKGRQKLKESDGTGEKGCQGQPQPQNLPPGVPRYITVSCHNLTSAAIADELHQMAGGYLDTPVVDSTGLKGSWDFDIKWSGRGQLAAAGADGISIFDAVDKQLGLKLELQKLPMPVIVIDRVNQKPTENLPGVTKALPVTPTEFEVAVVKPSAPDSRQTRSPFQPGGKLELQGFTLKTLIRIAWDINGDEMLVGAPKWLDSDKFDIIAKASTATLLHAPSNAPPVDIDALRLMLRALLVDRFKLAVHNEDRPVSAYTLVAVKPKLNKADPANRTRFKEGPALASKDPRDKNPLLGRLVTCQNMTLAQFAEQLQNIAPGYIHSPVLDATGIDGGWDFTLSFSPAGQFQGGGGRGGDRGGDRGGETTGPPSAAMPAASDPSGALTLFEAIDKQLGLKLELKKRPVSVLVIDSVEQKPTDN
ncbi:MAG TPA: TIGR03435 family protein [Candidatus Acidoferrales bacterium]|jgi:uncharacterized protein (TIGR03435 family)|nr:TIGR03435 family protein [Candidatus Acidoferrales bacterium]